MILITVESYTRKKIEKLLNDLEYRIIDQGEDNQVELSNKELSVYIAKMRRALNEKCK